MGVAGGWREGTFCGSVKEGDGVDGGCRGVEGRNVLWVSEGRGRG